jgi:zinc/manganese transport system substrate-binding protein
MKHILMTVIGVLLAVSAAEAKLSVVATTADLGAIAKEIGGENIELTTLGKPTEDPHFVDAKPSFIVKLNHADVVVEGGAELEIGWLPALLDQARNSKIMSGAPGHISCAMGVPLLDVPTTLDRSRGDIHAAGNPHYIVAPSNAKIVAKNIAEGFAANDPKSADAYRANLKKFDDAIDAKLVDWRKKLAPYEGQTVVAYHDSWPYFAKEYGLKMDLFLEPKPGIPPTPAHLAEVILKMKQVNAHVIIVDPYLNRKTADAVASHTGAKVVEVTQFPGGLKGTEGGYIEMEDFDVNVVAAALAQK